MAAALNKAWSRQYAQVAGGRTRAQAKLSRHGASMRQDLWRGFAAELA